MNDQRKLAALAALVGITPETHRHMYRNVDTTAGDDVVEQWQSRGFPALDTPAGDDVFLAPVMRWCQSRGLKPIVDGSTNRWYAWVNLEDGVTDQTMTAALIRACQSAGVPEICAIFGSES